MKSWIMAPALGMLAACATTQETWVPTPGPAADPSQTIADAPADAWRPVDPENLLLMDLGQNRRVAIELAADFAPVHVANIRALARSGWWAKAAIYRSQDNYVVQWGNGDAEVPLPAGVVTTPPAEYERPVAGLDIRPLGYPDAYAPVAGHAEGWPVGYDPARGSAWLTHCYGSVGVARDLAPDTGTGGELYAVIGHAPRQLDRNIAVVGRVLEGMEHLSTVPRGKEALGFIGDAADHVPIARIAIAADLPEGERPAYEVMRTGSESFSAYVKGRANRGGDFFRTPAGGVELCNAPVPVRRR